MERDTSSTEKFSRKKWDSKVSVIFLNWGWEGFIRENLRKHIAYMMRTLKEKWRGVV